jgi:hypothetical protein
MEATRARREGVSVSAGQRTPGPTTRRGPVTVSAAVVWLSVLVAVLALVATATGLLWSGGEAPATVESVHAETVALDGEGLYRHDSVFKGAANRGSDAVTVLVGLPLLLTTIVAYRRGSVRGALLLTGALAWFLYLYASLALGTAYNELFFVYVALFGASLYAFVFTLRSIDLAAVEARLGPGLPRRTTAVFLMISGAFTLLIWAGPLLVALVAGDPPELLAHSTTSVTEVLDLAVIVPATFIAGVWLLRGREALGYLVAVPLLVLLVVLTPVIAAQTAYQLSAGIAFTTAEIIGPISGFLVLGLGALTLIVRILRGVEATVPGP